MPVGRRETDAIEKRSSVQTSREDANTKGSKEQIANKRFMPYQSQHHAAELFTVDIMATQRRFNGRRNKA
jgi:hypothetical protein